MEELIQLYIAWKGRAPFSLEKIVQSGSNRTYVRLYDDAELQKSVIAVKGDSVKENETFIALAQHFKAKGLPVPEILMISNDRRCYLQTDVGKKSLYDCLKTGREQGGVYNEEEKSLIKNALQLLSEVQVHGAEGLDFSLCYPLQELTKTGVFFDLNYFKYCFLKTQPVDFDELRLEKAFHELSDALLKEKYTAFLYRDFQARNIMVSDKGELSFIDFQGGFKGPLQYDVVSFLWQASAHYSEALREEMITVYLDHLSSMLEIDRKQFKQQLFLFALFRVLQVLGCYGLRGYFERKRYFLESIPPAIENLKELIDRGVSTPFPYLHEILSDLVAAFPLTQTLDKTSSASLSKYENKGNLKVSVYSFSYKKGIPNDNSEHGGGYVFDCRAIHNPGRYDAYKPLTGLDKPVIDFLEQDGEVFDFLKPIYVLARQHVERYLKRGFTSLSFCFGCTGGRHRSVYCAQHLAEYISKEYGVCVELVHREQEIEQVFKARE